MKDQRCVLCGVDVADRQGNNPWPLASPKNQCCRDCNDKRVIPARVIFAEILRRLPARDAAAIREYAAEK